MNEAPISGSIKGYYKGYSVQITNRDPSLNIEPLLDKAKWVVEWMEKNGFKPSWNEDTNTKVNPSTKWMGDGKKCPQCGVPFLVQKVAKDGTVTLLCYDKKCGFKK